MTENGFGKRTSYLEYRVTNRGGKGIIGIINSPRNGNISSTLVVSEEDEIILSTDKGSIMRVAVKEIRVAGRNTQGVRIKKLSGEEKVVSVIKIEDNISYYQDSLGNLKYEYEFKNDSIFISGIGPFIKTSNKPPKIYIQGNGKHVPISKQVNSFRINYH